MRRGGRGEPPRRATSNDAVRPDTAQSGPNPTGSRGRQQYARMVAARPKFDGCCEDLKGFVFDIRAGQADQYVKSVREIGLYMGRTYTNGADVKMAIETLTQPVFDRPDDPPEDATQTETQIWKEEVKDFYQKRKSFQSNVKALYSLVWGQCSKGMQAKVEAQPGYNNVNANKDGIELLHLIKTVAFNYQSQKYLPHAVHKAKWHFYNCAQGRTATVQEYLEQFKNVVSVLDTMGAVVGPDPSIAQAIAGDGVQVQQAHQDEAMQWYLAVAFLLRADRVCFGKLIEDLENNYLHGQDNYPRMTNDAYNLLCNWKQDPRNVLRVNPSTSDGVAFMTTGDEDPQDINDDGAVALATTNAGTRKKTQKPKSKAHIASDVMKNATMLTSANSLKPHSP